MGHKPMTLYAQADLDSTGALIWSLGDTPIGKKGTRKTIQFPKDSGGTDITVRLEDNTGAGIRFKEDDPLWVQEGGTCPPGSAINSNQIPPGSIKCTKTDRLEFTNLNEGAGRTLIYQLNFVDRMGKDADPQLDPEFKNGGGGAPAASASLVNNPVTIIAGVALVAMVAYLWMRP